MENPKDQFQIKKNFLAISVFILIVLVLVDILLRLQPEVFSDGSAPRAAVGHHHQFKDGSSYYIYTIFEENGDVYQCWWDEKTWRQKKVTNYKAGSETGGMGSE
ncbi:MAG: hypothetical protein ACLFQB_00175 [Chitinispirillaceae bacterium]